MDNSLLLINCDKIEELVLLDEACGSPVDMDWDSAVSEGEIPAVVYEAFDDYMTYKDIGDTPSHYDLLQFINGKSTSLAQLLKIEAECITQCFRVSERVGDATHQFTGCEGKKCKQL